MVRSPSVREGVSNHGYTFELVAILRDALVSLGLLKDEAGEC
jgi:hypothetical protein